MPPIQDMPQPALMVQVEQGGEVSQPIPMLAAVPPARPGHFAEREELDAAIRKGSAEALQLFIERHPNSRYREEAEALLRKKQGQ